MKYIKIIQNNYRFLIFASLLILAAFYLNNRSQIIGKSHADDTPPAVTVPSAEVKAEQAGMTDSTVAVQVTWQLPSDDKTPVDAYGFIVDKEGPNGRAQAAIYYPYENGFDNVTGGGYYYDESVNIGEKYTYYVKTYDRDDNESDWASASITPEGIKIDKINNTQDGVNPVKVSWETNSITMGKVEYGTDTSYGTATDETSYLDKQEVSLPDTLSPGTTYHFRIKAYPVDEEDQAVYSADQTFITTPFKIIKTEITGITPVSATTTWQTNYPASAKLEYGIGGYSIQKDFSSDTTSYSLPNLTPGSNYMYRLTANMVGSSSTDQKTGTFSTTCFNVSNVQFDTSNFLPDVKVTWQSAYDFDGQVKYKDANDPNASWQSVNFASGIHEAILTNIKYNADYVAYNYQFFANNSNCVLQSGSFNPPIFTHNLTHTQVENKLTFHWTSNIAEKGTIEIKYNSGGIPMGPFTINVDSTKDKTIEYTFPVNDLISAGNTNDPTSGKKLYTVKVDQFFALSHPKLPDGTEIAPPSGQGTPYFIRDVFFISSPAFCMTHSTKYIVPDTINGTIQPTVSEDCTRAYAYGATRYDITQANLGYVILDNTGGVYTTAFESNTTVPLASSTGAFAFADVPKIYGDYNNARIYIKSFTTSKGLNVNFPNFDPASIDFHTDLNPLHGGRYFMLNDQSTAAPLDDGTFQFHLNEKIYFPSSFLSATYIATDYSMDKSYSYRYYIDLSNTGRITSSPTASDRRTSNLFGGMPDGYTLNTCEKPSYTITYNTPPPPRVFVHPREYIMIDAGYPAFSNIYGFGGETSDPRSGSGCSWSQ